MRNSLLVAAQAQLQHLAAVRTGLEWQGISPCERVQPIDGSPVDRDLKCTGC